MYDVIALGEMLIDFACRSVDAAGYPTMAANPGGAPANFLAALSKYGAKTALLSKVGNDAFGRMLTATLRDRGIDDKGVVVTDEAFTTLAFVTLDETGNREFSFSRKPGADTLLAFDEIDTSMIDETRVFHFGTLSLTDGPARGTTYAAVAYAKAHGKLITFDPNLRKPLWHDMDAGKTQMLWGLYQADVVKISDEEVRFLWDESPKEGAQRLLNEYGVKLAFVTCGADGCVYANRSGMGMATSPQVNTVDTTGAGDIFGGSALSRILKLNKKPEDLTVEEMASVTAFACTAASLSTELPGGITSVPDEEAVLARVHEA